MYESLVFALLLSLVALGCDANPGGYPSPQGNDWDRPAICNAQSTAWIRHALIGEGDTEEEQLVTELLILGHAVSRDDETGTDCLYLAQFDYEGSIVLDRGEFVLDEETLTETAGSTQGSLAEKRTYHGVWTTSYLYDFIHEPDKNILARRGAQRSAYPLPEGQAPPSLPRLPVAQAPPAEREIEFQRMGNRLSFTVDGETKWFEELGPLLSSLSPDDPAQLSYLARVANLGLLISQVRVIGFGSSGMTGYRVPKDFAGLMSGTLRVGGIVKLGKVNITMDYQDFSDIPGLNLHGPQLLEMSWSGEGLMGGAQQVELSMDAKSKPFASAEVDYGDVVVESGFADSGTLTVTFNDEDYEIDVKDALVVDFRGLIPFE